MTEGLLKHTSRQRDEARSELEDVARSLGSNYIGLKPGAVAMTARAFEDIRIDGSFSMPTPGGIATMHVLRMDCDQSPVGMTHIRIDVAGEKVVYAISAAALKHAQEHLLERRIGEEIARFLVRELRHGRATRPHAATPKDC